MCKNETSNVTCAPREEIHDYIDRLEIQIVYSEQYFDVDAFGNEVIKYKITDKYVTL